MNDIGTWKPPADNSQTSIEIHRHSDVDFDKSSLHHTLGSGPTQAAAGNHEHAVYFTTGDVKTSLAPADGVNWLEATGQAVSRTTFNALFALFGTTYGAGDGSTTFNLPDLRDRMLIGSSGTKSPGAVGGSATKTLSEANLPNHTHTINHGHNIRRSNTTASSSTLVVASGVSASESTQSGAMVVDFAGNSGTGSGSNTAFDVMNPWFALRVLIKT